MRWFTVKIFNHFKKRRILLHLMETTYVIQCSWSVLDIQERLVCVWNKGQIILCPVAEIVLAGFSLLSIVVNLI